MAYPYRNDYPSKKIDILHNSNQECCRQHVALNAVGDIDKGVSLSMTRGRAISATFMQSLFSFV